MKIQMIAAAAAATAVVAGVSVPSLAQTGSGFAGLAAASTLPACAPAPASGPPRLRPTTVSTIGEGYYCILAHYYAGPVLDDRTLLVAAFAAFTQELQRLGADQPDASMPALTGVRGADWAAFAAAYQRVMAGLHVSAAARQQLASATMQGMVAALGDDHAQWGRAGIPIDPLGMQLSGTRGLLLADPAAVPPLYVVSVQDLSPAALAGIKPGDEIRSVNGIPPFLGGHLSQDVLDLVDLPQGPVRLELYRPATGRAFSVTLSAGGPQPATGAAPAGASAAQPVPGSPVTTRLLPGDIGYLTFPGFSTGVAGQVLDAITKLKAKARGKLRASSSMSGATAAVTQLRPESCWAHGSTTRGGFTSATSEDSAPPSTPAPPSRCCTCRSWC
jgi:carboxyl-terminal processing protease